MKSGEAAAGDRASRWPIGTVCAVLILAALAGWWAVDVRGRSKIKPEKPQVHRTDLTVFTTAGRAFVDGDPTTDPYATPNFRGWHYNYPPLLAITLSSLAWLHPQVASGIWFTLSVTWLFGAWFECWRIHRVLRPRGMLERDRTLPWLATGITAAMVLPALNCLQRGQLGLLLLWLTLVALRLLVTRQSFAAGCIAGGLLALAAVIKVFPALTLLTAAGLALWPSPTRPRAVGVGLLIGAGAGLLFFLWLGPSLLIGFDANAQHLVTWWHQVMANPHLPVDTGFSLRSIRNQSLENAALLAGIRTGWSDHPLPAYALTLDPRWLAIRLILGLLLLVTAIRLARATDWPLSWATALALSCTATLVLSPLSWGHYFVMQLPALLLVPLWLMDRHQPRLGWTMLVAGTLPLLVHYLALPWAGPWGVLGLGTAAWFVLACLLIAVMLKRGGSTALEPFTSAESIPAAT